MFNIEMIFTFKSVNCKFIYVKLFTIPFQGLIERNVANMKKKFLGIAPYESMQSLMERFAEAHDDIDLTVFVGDLSTGAEIASHYTLKDYDIILSRGGTAELIRANSSIPVIEIELSIFDIFRVIKLAESSNEPYVIVGYPSITKNAAYLCKLFQYDLQIVTIHTAEEARQALENLQQQGCRLVLCDVVTSQQAQKLGIKSILFTSGYESIENAFNQGIHTLEAQNRLLEEIHLFKTLADESPSKIFLFNEQQELLYNNTQDALPDKIFELLQRTVPDILLNQTKSIIKEDTTTVYTIKGIKKELQGRDLVVYYLTTQKAPQVLTKHGLRFVDKEYALGQFYEGIISLLDSTKLFTTQPKFEQNLPIMLLGEEGTESQLAAYYLYSISTFQNKPLVEIDCLKINGKSWDFLLNHLNSPLNRDHLTILFENIEKLDASKFSELLLMIQDTNAYKRNQLIFTFNIADFNHYPPHCNALMNKFIYQSIILRTLRDNQDEIPKLVNLYTNRLNIKLGKEIVGFAPDALAIFTDYDWPGNYQQFLRMMKELFVATDEPYLQANTVKHLLFQECSTPTRIANLEKFLDLHRTLDEITLDVARMVLAEENGNQSSAAKRLGIGRTTLWRMLQSEK